MEEALRVMEGQNLWPDSKITVLVTKDSSDRHNHTIGGCPGPMVPT